MNPRLRFTLRVCFALTLSVSMLLPNASFFVSEAAQGQRQNSDRAPRPRPGKPEGALPNLEDIQSESQLDREAGPPIPSTIRSPKVPLQPWNGRRVGDPPAEGKVDQPTERGQTHRAHARRRVNSPPMVLDDQFVQNFFSWVVLRAPNSNEATFWNDQLRVAYAQGQTSVKLAAVGPGKDVVRVGGI